MRNVPSQETAPAPVVSFHPIIDRVRKNLAETHELAALTAELRTRFIGGGASREPDDIDRVVEGDSLCELLYRVAAQQNDALNWLRAEVEMLVEAVKG